MSTGTYTQWNKEGEWKYYHSNGSLRIIGRYEHRKDIGTWKYYDENTTLDKVEELETDKEAIVRTMSYYFDATRTHNPDFFKKAFHPKATLKFINAKGMYQMRTIQPFFSYFTNTKTKTF